MYFYLKLRGKERKVVFRFPFRFRNMDKKVLFLRKIVTLTRLEMSIHIFFVKQHAKYPSVPWFINHERNYETDVVTFYFS